MNSNNGTIVLSSFIEKILRYLLEKEEKKDQHSSVSTRQSIKDDENSFSVFSSQKAKAFVIISALLRFHPKKQTNNKKFNKKI